MPVYMIYKSYYIYFWSNENSPREPVHIHVSEGKPTANATKFWINSDGSVTMDNNNSRIPSKDLKRIEKIIESVSDDIVETWEEYFNQKAKFHDKSINNKFNYEKD